MHNWHNMQIDCVQVFPQEPVGNDLYMIVPSGSKVEKAENKDYDLQLHKNLYGQNQTGRVWYIYLTKKLTKELGFLMS